MSDAQSIARLPMLGIAFVQGICLFALYKSVESDSWPSESPLWSFPLWTLAIAVPLLLLLSIDRDNMVSATKHVAGFAVVLTLVAIYTGWQAEPFGEFPFANMTLVFTCSITLACFKALMYLQQRADGVPLTYQVLFTNSWRNFLVGTLAALFSFIVWMILLLWGQLFKVIDIDFFADLFTEDWFIIPLLTVAFGLGVSLFRALTRVIDNITKLLHWLIKLLLPLVLVVAIVFLAALPFAGLDLLWGTGSGTALLLWLLALLLFFTNAVYQDGRETNPYPMPVHRTIYIGLLVMPIVSGLSLYGLVLRLMQYGWTIGRSWAFVVWLILTLFGIGYVVGILRRRDEWTGELARVNTAMGLVVLVIMLLANSPLLDFRKISLASQLNRVESGEIELGEFDFWYAKNHLARPGHLAMQEMKAEIGDSDPEVVALIDQPTRRSAAIAAANMEEMAAKIVFRPEPFEIPASLKPKIKQHYYAMQHADPVLFQVDLNGDGSKEYVLVLVKEHRVSTSQFFYRNEDGWQTSYLNRRTSGAEGDIRDLIKEGEITLADPEYKSLDIGGIVFHPMPN